MPNTTASNQPSKPARRPRVPLSCDPCRTRKLKCNREQPCQNCSARDERVACRYKGAKNGTLPTVRHAGSVDVMQQRIEQLENLVKGLLTQQEARLQRNAIAVQDSPRSGTGSTDTAVASDSPDVEFSPGTTVFDGTHSVYKGADDWHDVLKEINSLKSVWNQAQHDQANFDESSSLPNTVDGSGLLFGQVKQIERFEILATFPPKPEIDKLLRQFFNQASFPINVSPIIHEPTFMREYNDHWKAPSKTNVIWLGLMFSILGIVMLSYHQYGEPPEYEGISESLFQLYRLRTAQCLMVGDIGKCLPYTLETLRFNATAELGRKDDNSRGLWIMTGIIVRAAINMGYHRDPSTMPISVLQAEYRRRVWYSVIGMDDVASFRVGFPRMMSAIYSNTNEPRNLHDWELSDESTILPSSRPLSEPTPVTYLIVKGRLFCAIARITDFNNTPNLGSYDTVLEIDRSMQNAYQDIPPHMRFDNTKTNLKDRISITSFQLDTMYHQGVCILHRKFLVRGRINPQYKLSRDRCISSALALLSQQYILAPSWYQFAQTRQVFTLAAMIIFLDLEHRRRAPGVEGPHDNSSLLQALERSCALWDSAKSSCEEALRVHQVLANMLSSFHNLAGDTSLDATKTIEETSVLPGFDPQLQPGFGNFSLEQDLFAADEIEFDWVNWDAYIEKANFAETET